MRCPISRALDRIGDRWTLLILRDLHAGPMRFSEIRDGLPGLATNLLTTRLGALIDDGLLVHDGALYRLSELGQRTDHVLWELARFGGVLPPDQDLRRPGHLRLVAITLQSALRVVYERDLDLVVELILDGESFTLALDAGTATVRYGSPADPVVVVRSSYDAMMDAAEGLVSLDEFRASHLALEGEPAAMVAFRDLMTRTMTEGFRAVR